MIYYELMDSNIFIKNFYTETNVTASSDSSPEDKKTAIDAWTSKLNDYDYVYLYKIDEDFIEQCSGIFVNGSADISENTLYRVIHCGDGILLERACKKS
jgi:hypothetical protein